MADTGQPEGRTLVDVLRAEAVQSADDEWAELLDEAVSTIEALEAERDAAAEAVDELKAAIAAAEDAVRLRDERLAAATPILQAAQRVADARRWHRRASEGGSWDDFDASSREMDAAHDALAAAFAHCQPRSPATGARRTNRSPEEKP